MSEEKTTATAVVTLTVVVELSQPWPAESTLEQVQAQAKKEALARLSGIAGELKKRGIHVGEMIGCRIVLNQERGLTVSITEPR